MRLKNDLCCFEGLKVAGAISTRGAICMQIKNDLHGDLEVCDLGAICMAI
jgi:hypothetical protein